MGGLSCLCGFRSLSEFFSTMEVAREPCAIVATKLAKINFLSEAGARAIASAPLHTCSARQLRETGHSSFNRTALVL